MEPRIETIAAKKLIGLRIWTNQIDDKTVEMWQSFMPRKKTIPSLNADLISMQIFDAAITFIDFTPLTFFEKWATVEVANFDYVPEGMTTHIMKGGLYAVFIHRGKSAGFQETLEEIFVHWLPNSIYALDDREHFEILTEKYKREDPESEEEVWIPVKLKNLTTSKKST